MHPWDRSIIEVRIAHKSNLDFFADPVIGAITITELYSKKIEMNENANVILSENICNLLII